MNRIIVKPLEGLCNRVRVVLTAHVIAQIYNKTEVMVCWGPGAGFSNDSWESLFHYPIYNISVNEYEELRKNGLRVDELTLRHPDTYEITQLNHFTGLDQKDLVYEGCQELQLYLTQKEQGFLVKQGFNWMLQQEYQSLRPSSAVRKIIKQVEFERQNTIGIHIRRGDAILCRDAYQYLSSQDAQFHNYVRNAMEHYPDIRFYLATDSEAVLKKFVEEYKDKILYLEKEFVPSKVSATKDGQLDATAELFLLSRTRKVIGTNFSSFSDTAAKMGGVALACPKTHVPRNMVAVQSNDSLDNLPLVSIVVAVMNRKERLLRTLPTWLAHSNVEEVVIVDWSSDEPLFSVAELDPRIRIVRVEGETRWSASLAFSLAIGEAKNEHVLKMDCDFLITDDFFEKNCLGPNIFYSGGSQTPKIWGLLYVNKHDFLAINGYNERIVEYGWEDEDCYQRLQNNGITRLPCHPDTASHLPHGHYLRTIHQPGVDCTTSPEKMKRIAQKFPPWGKNDEPSTYRYKNKYVLERDPVKPQLFIYGRPSTAWDSLDPKEAIEMAYQFIAKRSHNSPLLKQNMEYWYNTRKHFSYPEFRDALKQLATQNLTRTGIPFIEFPYDQWPNSPAVILLPIDDDDWLSPNIQQRVLKEFNNPDVDFVIWKDYCLNSVDRGWDIRPASIESVGSCSYAIRATAATLELLLWHMDMIGMLKTLPPNKYRLINDEALAIYNLHPGGAWYNTQRTQESYEENAHIPLPPCPQEVAWAKHEHFRLTRILQQLDKYPTKRPINKPISKPIIEPVIEPSNKTKKIF